MTARKLYLYEIFYNTYNFMNVGNYVILTCFCPTLVLPYFLSINFQSIQIFATLGHPQVAMKLANSFRDKQRISGQQDLRQKDIQPCDSWEKLEMD